jgi:hypothetical protein
MMHLVMSNMFYVSNLLDTLLHPLSHICHVDSPPASPGPRGPDDEAQRAAVGPTGSTAANRWRRPCQ